MIEYPLINYLPQLILAAVWFCPGLILGVIYGWRSHITFIMAQNGELEKENGFKKPISFLIKKHQTSNTEATVPMTDAITKIKESMAPANDAGDDDDDPWY